MPDKTTRPRDKAANASEQPDRYPFGMSPMHREIRYVLPAILTAQELEEFTGVPVERESR